MRAGIAMVNDDSVIAELVGELMNAHRLAPFKFGIFYNAKAEPARVKVHAVERNGTMGTVVFPSPRAARAWAADALREGYEVVRIVWRHDFVHASLSRRKRYLEQKAKYDAMSPAEKAIDDEIPF